MRYLVDANVALRFVNPGDAQHRVAVDCLHALIANGDDLIVSAQVMAEFWNVLTRPIQSSTSGGYGLTTAAATSHLVKIERLFAVVGDPPSLYAKWRELVISYGVIGAAVHDTRHAAWAITQNVGCILTFNVKHFTRFSEITVVNPIDVA